jgi:transposase
VALRLASRSVDAGRGSGRVERRRRSSRADKMRIIEETLAPGVVVTEIARRHGGPRLIPVRVAASAAESVGSIEVPAAMPARKRRGLIEIELGDGNRVSVDENVDAEAGGFSMF